jgi:hypothetical protein
MSKMYRILKMMFFTAVLTVVCEDNGDKPAPVPDNDVAVTAGGQYTTIVEFLNYKL